MSNGGGRVVLYSSVVYGKGAVLSEYDSKAPGSSSSFISLITEQVQPGANVKQSLVHENNCIHFISKPVVQKPNDQDPGIVIGQITFLAVSPLSLGKRLPFMYLLQLEQLFGPEIDKLQSDLNDDPDKAAEEWIEKVKKNKSLQGEIKELIKRTDNGESDTTGLAKRDIEEVKSIMIENVERIIERGERINLLVSKTDRMNQNSLVFRKRTIAVKRSMWWTNVKMTVLIVVIIIGVAYFLVGSMCGFAMECLRR
ncbi:vacuolar v-SNARE Nyv1p [Trichomonascus vanleenenianus]|uniref:synaptobrevin family protein n=1 Tax=Trichomonascus vanleenenianus TaxID=2268995 RepID=UPI003ECA2D04